MSFTHIVADMQLFKIAAQIKWSDPGRWSTLVIRPGGMHMLMSFLGCIGTLMQGSGLQEILASAYGGINNMMNGKSWPKAMRGFWMVLTALLKGHLDAGITTPEQIQQELDVSRQTPVGRLWVDCFIIPVIIAHLFVKAERESDWLLHLYCVRRMLCYFFAAGHWQYARYATWHVMDIVTANPEAQAVFAKGQHVCRHRDGVWNGVFSDQFGEQTYIRYGKSKGGLVGMTLSPDQVSGWILSSHICNMPMMVSCLADDSFIPGVFYQAEY